jgi:hypothetical protein
MREIRTSGSEGGAPNPIDASYPYRGPDDEEDIETNFGDTSIIARFSLTSPIGARFREFSRIGGL